MRKVRIAEATQFLSKFHPQCPFSDSPIEICKQFEQIANGICEAINPEFESVYDKMMMTKGDKSCHWVIKRKGETELRTRSSISETPLDVLKMRFVKGEISEEEYKRTKAVIE